MTNRSLLAAAVAASLFVSFGSAQAATTSSTFTVSATLANNCSVSAANVGFGSVNAGAAATNTSSSITLTCNKGATVSAVALNNGANPSGTQKRMINGTETLDYKIDVPTGATFNTCPAAGTSEWNASSPIVATSLFAATGGPKLINICASIPSGQFPAAGAYTDTVTVTATFN